MKNAWIHLPSPEEGPVDLHIEFLKDFEERLFLSEWHKGPPPSIGWWPASIYGSPAVLRWWDGKGWSWPLDKTCSELEVALCASVESMCQRHIRWRQRPKDWPERSRT